MADKQNVTSNKKNPPLEPLQVLELAIQKEDWALVRKAFRQMGGTLPRARKRNEQGSSPPASSKPASRPTPGRKLSTKKVANSTSPSATFPARDDELEKYRVVPRDVASENREDGRRPMRRSTKAVKFSNHYQPEGYSTKEKKETRWINKHVKRTPRREGVITSYKVTCPRCKCEYLSDTPESTGEINTAVCMDCINAAVRRR